MRTKEIVYSLGRKCEPLPEFNITKAEYERLSKSPWPLNALVTEHYKTPAFKFFVADPYYQLPEAKTFRLGRYLNKKKKREEAEAKGVDEEEGKNSKQAEEKSVDKEEVTKSKQDKGTQILEITEKTYKPCNYEGETLFKCEYTRNPPKQVALGLQHHVKEFKKSKKANARVPVTRRRIDNFIQRAATGSRLYIQHINYKEAQPPAHGIFHNPSAIASPLNMAYQNYPPYRQVFHGQFHRDACWYFLGGSYSSSCLHFDIPEVSVINTLLNKGMKLWIIIDPKDTEKLILILQKVAGDERFCHRRYGKKEFLLTTATLVNWGIKFYVTVQQQHETIVMARRVLHQVVNLSFCVSKTAAFLDEKRCTSGPSLCVCGQHAAEELSAMDGSRFLEQWKLERERDTKKASNVSKLHGCTVCEKKFGTAKGLRGHLKTHQSRAYRCDYDGCDKTFTENSLLVQHKKIHYGIPVSCSVTRAGCKYTSHRRADVEAHKKNKEGYVHFCTICGHEYNWKQNWLKHVKKKHGTVSACESSLICD